MLRSFTSYHPGLLTDLYHPDAAYVSWRTGQNGSTTFDLFARRAPYDGAYMLVAGIETALEFVREFHYSEEDLWFLSQIRDYDPGFLDALRNFRFSGEILAMPEGSIAFPNEPILRVSAPFREALLLESGLLQAINLATLIATKAARITQAARGRRIAEFALRRAQDPYVVARASYIGGATSTSFLGAAFRFRLLATGSIPHALVQLYASEEEAFTAVAESYNRYTLLIDTYDARRAIHTAIDVARRAQQDLGHSLAAIRLDSGDFASDSRYIRAVLDEAGMRDVRILVSGDMDEFTISDLLDAGAPIDAFGVGTSLGVGAGSVEYGIEGGALGGVYKEVWYENGGVGEPKIKVAGPKSTWPGRKELYRIGAFESDWIGLENEPPPARGTRLLKPVMRGGVMIPGSLPPVSEIWELAQANLRELPDCYKAFKGAPQYPVEYSAALQALRDSVLKEHANGENHTHPTANDEPTTPRMVRDEHAEAVIATPVNQRRRAMQQTPRSEHDALILVDVQNDFCPGGALAVSEGDEIIPVLNRLVESFPLVVATQDWHPANHRSFSRQGGPWPPHCIAGTPGADFHPALNRDAIDLIVRKATTADEEAYSGFDGTDLAAQLRERGVERVFVAGLALDYCVDATALDARRAGFETLVVRDATRPVFDNQVAEKEAGWRDAGIATVNSAEIAADRV